MSLFPPSPDRTSDRPSVAIIGGGVCGLGIGWRLAQAGCKVALFERGKAGHGASWAAAGMLAAGLEAEPGEERLLALNQTSQRLWPSFRDELEAASGIGIGYRDEGTLLAALNRDDVEQLRFTYEFQHKLGIELAWLNGLEARRREPHLRPGTAAAIFSPNDHQVDNRRLALALREAFTRAGGRLHEDTAVEALEMAAGRVRGLRVAGKPVAADAVVLAAGPWSAQLADLPAQAKPPVRPIKGQMLALRMDPAQPLLEHVLWAPKIYLVPRHDGRLIIGGTVEEKGFDASLTAGGVLALLEAAWRAVPAIEELPIDELWVGHRPGSRDDAPILGPCDVPGLHLATGHHRNGILLTPLTAATVSEALLTGRTPALIADFTLARFAPPPLRQAATG